VAGGWEWQQQAKTAAGGQVLAAMEVGRTREVKREKRELDHLVAN